MFLEGSSVGEDAGVAYAWDVDPRIAVQVCFGRCLVVSGVRVRLAGHAGRVARARADRQDDNDAQPDLHELREKFWSSIWRRSLFWYHQIFQDEIQTRKLGKRAPKWENEGSIHVFEQEYEMQLEGIYPIVPTPFDNSGGICTESMERLTAFMTEKRVSGLAVLGVMGEGNKLDEAERSLVVRTFRAALPTSFGLVVGVRATGTDLAVKSARSARDLGADAILLGPPPIQDDDAIFSYTRQVSESVDVPIVLHDYPAATKVLMSVRLITRLFGEIERVEYIKLEDPPTGPKMARLQSAIGDDVQVFGALGGLYAFEELNRGAVGIMTGFAYPELLVDMYNKHASGDIEGAATVFYDILPLIRFEFQPGIGISLRKHILKKRGVFKTTKIRHPGADADAKTLEHLERILKHLRSRGYYV